MPCSGLLLVNSKTAKWHKTLVKLAEADLRNVIDITRTTITIVTPSTSQLTVSVVTFGPMADYVVAEIEWSAFIY